ncbi:Abi family protein [Magnetovibrio sp. PR-2]|uniref:Abi family protein n=1 Tax=Magnetovibrio sp. PR-2 TaxID=3120356 RepID=UPI002FCE0BA1
MTTADGKQAVEEVFEQGTSFNDIINLYVLDRELRLFLLGPVEKIEIALRGKIISHIGNNSDRGDEGFQTIKLFARHHYNLTNNRNKRLYNNIVHKGRGEVVAYLKDAIRSEKNEDAKKGLQSDLEELQKLKDVDKIADVINEYSPYHIMHRISFGVLVNIFNILHQKYADAISQEFGFHTRPLRSVLSTLIEVRNACAHHEPIWFRSPKTMVFPREYYPEIYQDITKEMLADPSQLQDALPKQGLYVTCAAMHLLLNRISETTTWYARFKPLIYRFQFGMQSRMGFPRDWDELPFWRGPLPPMEE